ncbi:MAG TPA: single-stranded-DNA-specific exonuclease RecJ [Candidatus Acidoferrales bacterium]|nr:single-stranded-DNA-specific exonuclease RecJ [Candidatus Acidoferrales bacterium]
MEKRWVIRQADERVVARLSESLRLPPLIGRILAHRGLTEVEEARRFLSSSLRSDLPPPSVMAGMNEAAARLARALAEREKICVWGDYDVDGTTGAATLVLFLRALGADPLCYIPHRINEGYGVNAEGVRRLASLGARLVVTVDCGISNPGEIELARALGMDVVIVDHHLPPPVLPPATAVLNPHRQDCPFPDKALSAAGLVFYLLMGVRARLREIGWFSGTDEPDVRSYLDVIALGTIADMVPLRGANRVLTRRGLIELERSSRPGILALKKVAGVADGKIEAGRVGFQLAPRINAAGRVDAALKVVEMLTTDSYERAYAIARELDENNRARQAMEAAVLDDALARITGGGLCADGRFALVVAGEGWHPGVLGIVASRLVERFYRPTVVIGFERGQGKGSARSIRGFHITNAFRDCADLLVKFGGHEYAAGLSINEDCFALFCARFEELSKRRLKPEDLVPALEIDAALDFRDVTFDFATRLEALAPFGIGNPEPLFVSYGVEVAERKDLNGCARLRLKQGSRTLTGLDFRKEPASSLTPGAKIDLAFRVEKNEWDGTWGLELNIADARPAAANRGGSREQA